MISSVEDSTNELFFCRGDSSVSSLLETVQAGLAIHVGRCVVGDQVVSEVSPVAAVSAWTSESICWSVVTCWGTG